MTGRPRTSTLVISGLFLAVLVLYYLVRPVPASDTSAGAGQSASTTSPKQAVLAKSPAVCLGRPFSRRSIRDLLLCQGEPARQ